MVHNTPVNVQFPSQIGCPSQMGRSRGKAHKVTWSNACVNVFANSLSPISSISPARLVTTWVTSHPSPQHSLPPVSRWNCLKMENSDHPSPSKPLHHVISISIPGYKDSLTNFSHLPSQNSPSPQNRMWLCTHIHVADNTHIVHKPLVFLIRRLGTYQQPGASLVPHTILMWAPITGTMTCLTSAIPMDK